MPPLTKSDPAIYSGHDVTAIVGPTNTGKTHLAIERMVAHRSGVIGLPLRLLAREVYGRVAAKVGTANVALITGEEKIVPPGARYSVCTVEAMPRETDAAFVAIDEVQLAGDLERGHIFTDRVLNLRGAQETLLLGAGTIGPILKRMMPGLSVVSRPRMSHLAYAGSKKITRLPRRSAVVAFSASEVYAIAELIRRQRGGAAVVMGALSPRTRNAQVALYQSGDVDYLVATDAIGMGLNLDVDHVAFAQNQKFDGHKFRELTPAEMGQIAGRAGRHINDGTFGVTGHVAPLTDELVEAIEGHQFEPVRILQWRNRALDYSTLESLRASLERVPSTPGLTRALPAVDQRALEFLARDDATADLCTTPERVETLWEACALPDYRKIAPAQHADIIAQVFGDLMRHGHIDEDYMAEQVRRADRTDGEIDTLSHRISQIRTWTYIANRPGWLADPQHWQEKTRAIEDKLSDALHERLTKRFVDRRTSVLMKRLRENVQMQAEIDPQGGVVVEGHHVGTLEGFRFSPDNSANGEDAKAVKAAAQKALATEFDARAERFAAAPNGDLAISDDGLLRWLGAPVATLVSTDDWLKPRAVLLADEQLTGPLLEKVQARTDRFVAHHIETLLKPLTDLGQADELSGIARGIAFRLIENHGIVERREIAGDVKSLDQDGRAALRRYGVRFGFYHIFIPALIKPAPAGLSTLLWSLGNDGKDKPGLGDVVTALAAGRTSVVTDESFEPMFYRLAGFRLLGPRAVRVDILERLADLIRPCIYWKPGTEALPDGAFGDSKFVVTPAMMSILGATAEDMEHVLKALGYRHEAMDQAAAQEAIAALQAAHAPKPQEAGPAPEPAAPAEGEGEAAKVDAPADAAAGGDAVESAAQTAAAEPVADTPAAEPAEMAAEAAPAPDAPSVAESEAASAAEPEAGAEPVAVDPAPEEAPAEPEEPKMIFVWRQARNERGPRGNRGRRPQQHGDADDRGQKRERGPRPGGHGKPGKGNKRGGKHERPQAPRAMSARPPKSEKMDPDSPFAKLQALKEQFKK